MKKITKILLPAVALMAMGGQVVNPITNTLNEVHQNDVKKAEVANLNVPDPTASGVTLNQLGQLSTGEMDDPQAQSGRDWGINYANGESETSGYISDTLFISYEELTNSYAGTDGYICFKMSKANDDFFVDCDISYRIFSKDSYNYDVFALSSLKDGVEIPLGGSSRDLFQYYNGSICLVYSFNGTPSSLVDGGVKDLYYYVPSVPTMQDILGGISANDLFGVDCAVDCSDTERGKYSQAIGVYSVKITATDTYGQTATATLNIHIIDNGKPVIALASGKNLSFVSGSSSLKLADLPSYFTITDVGTSYGGTIGTPSYTYDGASFTDKTFGASDFGTHTVGVTVADSSGNSTTTNFSLSVTDGTAPVIARRDSSDVSTVIKIGVSRTFTLTKAEFLQIFKATDNVDGDLSANLDVEGDMFGNKVGNYSVKVVCSDKSGNKGSVTATVQVIADLPPVFILSDTLVQATTAQPLSTADLTSVVTNGILSGKTVTACSVNAGTYIGNENVAGDYTITYDATVASGTKSIKRAVATNDVSGSFILRVTKAAAENTDADTTHWYTPIVEFFQKLGNWFKGVFTKFKFDCFITNTEWDARYPATEKGSGDSTSSPAVETSSTGEAGM